MTYKRHHILEEAIQSFLGQDFEDCEMVVLNDCPDVSYIFNHPKIRVINHPTRFNSLGKKLEFGCAQCRGEYIFRLDDDDLLMPNALSLIHKMIGENEGYDIYRCKKAYFFRDNIFESIMQNVNTGNCYRSNFIKSIIFPDVSIVEDVAITYESGGKICEKDYGEYAMIYRWNWDTYHISGFGTDYANNQEYLKDRVEEWVQQESGVITLNPHFKINYLQDITKVSS